MLKKVILLFVLFPLSTFINAQMVDDTLRSADSTQFYLGETTTGIVNRTESSRSFVISNLLRFNITRKRIAINTTNSYVYGNQQTGLTNNDFTSVVDVSFLKSVHKLYSWTIATYDKSYSLKITDRLQAGAGLGYTLFDNAKAHLIISDGILYEYTDLYDNPLYYTFRNSFRIKYHFIIGKVITFDGTNFLQQSFEDEKDYILRLNNSLSLKIKDWISFTIASSFNRLNLTNKQNFLCNIGLSFQKTFTTVKSR